MTAPPFQADLVVLKGATWRYTWTLTDPESGNGLDLTQPGYSARGQIRPWYGSSQVLYAWADDEENLTLSADGKVELTVPASESAAWLFWEGVYDIELTAPDTSVYRIAAGSILVSPEVTQ